MRRIVWKLVIVLLSHKTTFLWSENFLADEILLKMAEIPGWCSRDKALLMMNIIKENRCQISVEIGVFAGKSLFPIAEALRYNGVGLVFGIDAWNSYEALQGFNFSDPNYEWWSQIDFDDLYQKTIELIDKHTLKEFSCLLRKSAQNALHLFLDETIDFIHFDGNHNEEYVFQDIESYFPKVKDGGYILLNDPNWASMKRSLVFLLERTEVISPFTRDVQYLLFRKNKQRIENAKELFKNDFNRK
jgi:hypothetical protein